MARQLPAVMLHSIMSFDACQAGTRMVEDLRITAPRPLASFTVCAALAAHAEMLAGIERHFVSAPSSKPDQRRRSSPHRP